MVGKIIIGVVIVAIYLIMSFVTLVMIMYSERTEGSSPKHVYSDMTDYYGVVLAWPIVLPILVAFILLGNVKKWAIALVELLIAMGEKTNEQDKH